MCVFVTIVIFWVDYRIARGEVFQLMTKLSDDWGWGRSQKTGESGLIPIVIMEDVVRG
jgi:hypothetical protein